MHSYELLVSRFGEDGELEAYGVGDDAGAATGSTCTNRIDESQVMYWDSGGAWISAKGRTAPAPRQVMMAIEFQKRA